MEDRYVCRLNQAIQENLFELDFILIDQQGNIMEG